MTEVSAQREFEFVGADGTTKVVASIGKPAVMPDAPHGDWYCPYLIEGPDRRREMFGTGVDTLQALLLAISGLRAELEFIGRKGKLSFLEHDDLMISLVIAPPN